MGQIEVKATEEVEDQVDDNPSANSETDDPDELEILELEPSHYVLSGPFESAAGVIDLDQLRTLEERLRNHPVTAPLNRAWMATARRGV